MPYVLIPRLPFLLLVAEVILLNLLHYFLESDNGIEGKVLAALMIGEFVFLYLIFDSILYQKKTGLMHYMLGKCKGNTNGTILKYY